MKCCSSVFVLRRHSRGKEYLVCLFHVWLIHFTAVNLFGCLVFDRQMKLIRARERVCFVKSGVLLGGC
jgi:hypothetical protein